MHLRRWLLGALALVSLGLGGCTDEVEDINRVQPHYQAKSALDGEWYYRQTVVDFPATAAYGFTGIECGLEKIRFEVREDLVIAYRVHEVVPGLDALSTLPGAEYTGDPVASWPIISHFDIIRDFDRSTGAQSNVIVEDSTLRPWWQRDYLRVNWATPMQTGPVDCSGLFTLMSEIFQGATPPGDYGREHDKFDPDAMQVGDDHMMVTQVATTSDGGLACLLAGHVSSIYGQPCGSVEVKVRHGFKRIDADEVAQFEPAQHLDSEMMQEGAESFTDTNQNGRFDDGESFDDANDNGRWDNTRTVKYATVSVGPERGTMVDVACTPEVLDTFGPEITVDDCRSLQWHENGRFGYFRTEKTAYDRRVGGGHDHNRIHLANHHQIWKATKDADGVRIPLKARALRPVIYHLNADFPDDLKATAAEIAADWNDVFMNAAMAATGKDPEAIASQLRGDYNSDDNGVFLDGQDAGMLFQIRENSCSPTGIERYVDGHPAMQETVDAALAGATLQVGNMARVCAALTQDSATFDRPFVWQQMGDIRFSFVWWVNQDQASGPLGYGPSSADQETGQLISGNAHVYGAAIDVYARRAADIVRYINGELCTEADDEDLCLLEGRSFAQWISKTGAQAAISPVEVNRDFQQRVSERLGTPGMEGYRPFKTDNGFDKARMHSHMRERMRSPHGSDPMKWAMDTPVNEGQARLEALKQNPTFRSRMLSEPMVQAARALHGLAPNEPLTEAAEAFALDLAVDRGAIYQLDEERSRLAAENNIFLADGMDDSVIGQAIALKGLEPEEVYQQLRREIFKGVMLHEIGHTVGLRHNFKASYDALNYQDDFWQIRERYSPDEWDAQRLPEYRYASIMDYGARFNSDTKGLGKYDNAAIKYVYGQHVEAFAAKVDVPGRLDLELEFQDYTKIPAMLGGDLSNLTARTDRPVAELRAEKLAGVLRNAEKLLEDREQSATNFWTERTVPYFYCTDDRRGDLKCRTWDEGANHTEVVQSAIQRYWNYFLFSNYRRGRNQYGFIQSFFGRQARLAEYLSFPWSYYRFYDAYPVDTRDDLLRAATLGLNFVSEVIGTPEPGQYCLAEGVNTYLPNFYFNYEFQRECDSINVGLGEGRGTWSDFNDEYNYQYDYLGTYYDKDSLLDALFQNRTRFFRVTDDTDARAFTQGFYSAFQGDLVDLLSDMMVSSLFFFRSTNMFQRLAGNDGLRTQLFVDPRRVGLGRNDFEGIPRVYTQLPYNMAWRSIALAAAFNTNSHDRKLDFVEYISISEVGSGDDRQVGEGVDAVTFVHPHTGQTFRATRAADGRSLAFDLLALSQNYANSTWIEARDALADARRMGEGNIPALQEEFNTADERLQEMVEFMTSLRELKSWFDVGRAK
ncbi:MAG: hypothetical protein ACI9U2_000919 [Bradymonadia bacterium]|jgi:hypothetical protein